MLLEGESVVIEFEFAGRDDGPVAVEERVGAEAIGEDDMLVVVELGEAGSRDGEEQEE